MDSGSPFAPISPALPAPRLSLGVSGHRDGNAAFAASRARIEETLDTIFDAVERATARCQRSAATTRLLSPLAPGADLLAASLALARGWDLVAPLPFGLTTSVAINIADRDPEAARAMLDGGAAPTAQAEVAREIAAIAARGHTLQLADDDVAINALLRRTLTDPDDTHAAMHLATGASQRAAAASRLVVEHADVLIAIWDGETPGALGGTRDTMMVALSLGVPVLWIDAGAGGRITLLRLPEDLAGAGEPGVDAPALDALFDTLLTVATVDPAGAARSFEREKWRPYSPRLLGAYRWIENAFAGPARLRGRMARVQPYETPAAILTGSAAPLVAAIRTLPGIDPGFVAGIESEIIARFAWADGISTYLSAA